MSLISLRYKSFRLLTNCSRKRFCLSTTSNIKNQRNSEISDIREKNSKLEVGDDFFPKSRQDLNVIGKYILGVETGLESELPGFNDKEYLERRNRVAEESAEFKHGDKIPEISYSDEEVELWGKLWDYLIPLQEKHACAKHLEGLEMLRAGDHLSRERIPLFDDLNAFFKDKSGIYFRPVAGMLNQREFLNSLAFKVFNAAQFLRHCSNPLFAPEPDLVHEIFGHVPLFCNKEFVEMSQRMGFASLGAKKEELQKLADIYLWVVEFGLCTEQNKRKIFGAGLLGSALEIERVMQEDTQMLEFNLDNMSKTVYSLTEQQQFYFQGADLDTIMDQINEYLEANFDISSMKYLEEEDRLII